MNLVLIGLRGTGKTSVARLLAERLAWPWHDADQRIEALAGKSIAEIFADDGEALFRDLEAQVVEELAVQPRAVLALGGGAVVRESNRAAILRQGKVVWLKASPEELWGRISADPATSARRPNLSITGGINEIIATLAAREAIYRQCAELEIDTQGKTPAVVADIILEKLLLAEGAPHTPDVSAS